MKKLLFVLIICTCFTPLLAEDFAEEDLIGTWVLTEKEGDFVYKYDGVSLACPTEFEFYSEDQHAERSESLGVARYEAPEQYSKSIGIGEYFLYISSNGQLRLHVHIQGNHRVVRYIVNYIDSNRMELQTYDKKGRVMFLRKGSETNVRSVTSDNTSTNTYYSLNGERLSSNPPKGIFIKNRKKQVVR